MKSMGRKELLQATAITLVFASMLAILYIAPWSIWHQSYDPIGRPMVDIEMEKMAMYVRIVNVSIVAGGVLALAGTAFMIWIVLRALRAHERIAAALEEQARRKE